MASTLLDELMSAPDTDVESTHLDRRSSVEFSEHPDDGLVVAIRDHKRESNTLVSNASQLSHLADDMMAARGPLPEGPWNEPAYRLHRLALLKVANTRQADLFITDDRFLLEVNDLEFRGTNVVSTIDGISILGAHLRNRKIFTYKSSPDGRYVAHLVGNSFYVACRSSIQDLSPILDVQSQDPAIRQLIVDSCFAIIARTEQLLRARDSVIFALLQPHDHDIFDDALLALDVFLVTLGSIFDSLAEMTNAVLGLNSGAAFPDWLEKRWMSALHSKDTDFARLVAPRTAFCYLLQLHALLRNEVHGSIHQPVIFTDNMLPPEGFIVIPEAKSRLARRAVTELGGYQRFGAVEQDEEFWLRPGPLLETLLEEGMSFVNIIVRKLSCRLPPGEPSQDRFDSDDDDVDLRCAYLAGLSGLAALRFQRS